MVAIKVFGTAIRGLAERGGWVSIIASGGKTLFERKGDLDTQFMRGEYRPMASVPLFNNPDAKGAGAGKVQEKSFEVTEVALGSDEDRVTLGSLKTSEAAHLDP